MGFSILLLLELGFEGFHLLTRALLHRTMGQFPFDALPLVGL
jgi:hypothetical protein